MKQFSTPLEAFLYWEETIPNHIFLKQPINGTIKEYSYKSAGIEIRKIAAQLQDFGLSEKSHIALLSKNCAHWLMSDLAIMMAGMVSIPIYPTLNAKTIHLVLTHSESKAIIVGKLDNYSLLKEGIPDIPRIGVETFGINEQYIWEKIIAAETKDFDIKYPKPEDLHTIIYTSGTTGTPKGVMHSKKNFMVSVQTLSDVIKVPDNPRMFSYLPLAHVAERLIWTYFLNLGGQIRFPESLETFASDLEATQPHAFFAVPRIWAKFQESILNKIPQKKLSTLLKIPIISTLVKSKLQKKLGLKNASLILSGAAPISKEQLLWFKTIGIEILQIYGMTEDSCVSHSNSLDANKIGTVGKPLPGVKIKLSPEGEICIKNNSLMLGYFKAPEITASVFDEEGYFKTGDKGEYDSEGFMTITGRVKDQFKTDKGKYISPAPIELELIKNPNIDQVCIVGTGIPQPIALITLSDIGKKIASEFLSSNLELSVMELNSTLEKHEKIEKVVIIKQNWTVENNYLTPTLKLKRNLIEKEHQHYYKKWFQDKNHVIYCH
jgi:long-chain acyl-CoA synthetase